MRLIITPFLLFILITIAPSNLFSVTHQSTANQSAQERSYQEADRLEAELLKLYKEKKYTEALTVCIQLINVVNKQVGTNHPRMATSILMMAELHNKLGESKKAETEYLAALQIAVDVYGSNHTLVADIIKNIGLFYFAQGKYDRAEVELESALSIREKISDQNNQSNVEIYLTLGALYKRKGDNVKTESSFQRALAIQETNPQTDPREMAKVLADLANINVGLHRSDKAESLYRRLLEIQEKTSGPESLDVARTLLNLATLLRGKKDLSQSELFSRRVLSIYEKISGPESTDVADALNELGLLYSEKQEYEKAEPLFLRSLAIKERILGPDSLALLKPLNDIVYIYTVKRDFDKIDSVYNRIEQIQQKSSQPDNPVFAYTLYTMANVYREKGDLARAESLLEGAIDKFTKIYGPDYYYLATLLDDMAFLDLQKRDYLQAEKQVSRALAITEKNFGPDSYEIAERLLSRTFLGILTNNIDQAISSQSRADDIIEQDFVRNLGSGSENEKLVYINNTSYELSMALTLNIQMRPDNLDARRLALTVLLRRKGRALDAMATSIAQMRERAAPKDKVLFDELASVRAELTSIAFGEDGVTNDNERRDKIKRLESRIEEIESEISLHSAEFRARIQPVTLDAVWRAVPKGATLIEFVQYNPLDAKGVKAGSARYAAYILPGQIGTEEKSKTAQPISIDLGEAGPIDSAIAALRSALRDPKRTDVKQLARSVDAMTMQPVRAALGQDHWLLVSPDGALNLVPFGALVDEQGSYLVEKYLFTYLTSGRDLLQAVVSSPGKQAAIIFANPDFGEKANAGSEGNVTQQNAVETSAFSRLVFSPLPGTAEEGKQIASILENATLLDRQKATKPALKQVASPLILHIATHGFFLEDQKQPAAGARGMYLVTNNSKSSDSVGPANKAPAIAGVANPLLRSGLILAGANRPTKDDDGILTALEAAGLDLRGTKLVVLSACETGVGEIKNGEGVYGLRRAFTLAGSESQIMSLWSVNDAATRDLMIGYYKELLNGAGRSDALRNVQLKMISDSKYQHPAYWAGFIQSGQWSPIVGFK